MFGYYLDLARRSLKRNVSLTVLMILAIAFGVGASMTTLTVLRLLSADPLPGHSHEMYAVQLDPQPAQSFIPGRSEPPDQVTRFDAEALLRAKKGVHQAVMTGGNAAIEPERTDLPPFYADTRYTSTDFFPMFRVPFAAGAPWSADDDDHAARVVVVTRDLAGKLFGGIDVVGRAIRVEGTMMRIVGVLDEWRPSPHFYDLHANVYGVGEQLFVPFTTSRELKLSHSGSTDCWGNAEDQEAVNAPCVWLQYWVELPSAEQVRDYQAYLTSYSHEQMTAGRYQRPPNARLRDVIEWLDFNKVVPPDATLQTWIALGFLLVCLINTVGLLLTKFLRRSADIGVRRALGASKSSIFIQLLVEAGTIGLLGGLLGLGLAWLGLWAVRHQPTDYADLARLDWPMLLGTFGLAIVSSLLAGILPAWRGCQVAPALQLKSH